MLTSVASPPRLEARADSRSRTGAAGNPHLRAIRRDIQRYIDLDLDDAPAASGAVAEWLAKVKLCLTTPGLIATLVYRYGHWVYGHTRFASAWLPLKIAYRVLDLACSSVWGVHIDVRAQVGGGLYVGHADGILIGPVKMGVDCTVGRQVTIGRRADGRAAVPVLGDRIYIGISSVIFGDVRIGDGVTIAPLTVVGRSVPAAVLVAGSPMRVLRARYDNSMEIYGRHDLAGLAGDSAPSHDAMASAGRQQ